jgi:hypothetical protein
MRRRRKMATQMQATPTLYGEDAKAVLDEVLRKPTKEQREKLRDKYRKLFEDISTKDNK